MPDQPAPLPQATTSLGNIAFQTLQGAGGCKTPAFFADIPFDRSTGENPEGYLMNGLNKDGYDKLGYDWQGYNKDGINRNGYDKDGNYDSQCGRINAPPPDEPD